MSYYTEHAEEYIASTLHADLSECYAMFEPYLPQGGSVLDVGFGSGRDMLYFKSKGYEVYGIDAEPKFVEHARALGLKNVEVADVLQYAPTMKFDGIWACASLLHLPLNKLDEAIKKLLSMLNKGGVLFASMKEGSFEGVDEKGRPMLKISEHYFDPYPVIASKRTIEKNRGIAWINVVIQVD